MHQTRKNMPKTWPLLKKGTKYIIANPNEKCLPLVILLRDILKVATKRKEAKRMIITGKIKVNNKVIKEDNYPLSLYDTVSVGDKNYKIILGLNKKFGVEETKDIEYKIVKIIGKRILNKDGVQINFSDGRNCIVKINEGKKINIGDSAIINLKDSKIKEILELKEGQKTLVIGGKHLGKKGIIKSFDKESKMVVINTKDGKLNIKSNYIIVEK